MIQVDLRSRTPIYLQIVQNVKMLIINGDLQPDEKLPSVRDLSTELVINPNTIQKAFRMLEQEGFLYSVPGKGSYVMRLDGARRKEQQQQILEEIAKLVHKAFYLGLTHDEICSHLAVLEKERNYDSN